MIAKVPTSTCINGDVIAEDVYDIKGIVLIKKHSIMNSQLKNELLNLQVQNVSIYNPIQRIHDSNSLYKEMLHDIRKSLSEVIFRKEYMYTRVTQYLARMYESIDNNSMIINALTRIKSIDEYTFNHSINTAFYSMFIAIWMKLDDQSIINATQAGLLHDIGKIYIPQKILNKPGKLTAEEYELVKKHSLYGYFLLNEFGSFNKEVKRAVLFHHERLDSNGYPFSASFDYIGSLSKIVAVADVYDAMTTNRVYKQGVKPIEAINYLSTEGIKVLDREIIEKFLTNLPIYDFKLSN